MLEEGQHKDVALCVSHPNSDIFSVLSGCWKEVFMMEVHTCGAGPASCYIRLINDYLKNSC